MADKTPKIEIPSEEVQKQTQSIGIDLINVAAKESKANVALMGSALMFATISIYKRFGASKEDTAYALTHNWDTVKFEELTNVRH